MSGYVSKDQVIEWFRPYGHVNEGIPYYELVTDIRDMPDADVVPSTKWTFVSDGLPPEFEYVLCLSEYSCRDENDEPKAMFRNYGIRRYIDGGWFGCYSNEVVLGWMLIPEPTVIGRIMTKDKAKVLCEEVLANGS